MLRRRLTLLEAGRRQTLWVQETSLKMVKTRGEQQRAARQKTPWETW